MTTRRQLQRIISESILRDRIEKEKKKREKRKKASVKAAWIRKYKKEIAQQQDKPAPRKPKERLIL